MSRINFIFIIGVLTLASFWRILTFDFRGDDWMIHWVAYYYPSFITHLTQHPVSWLEEFLLVRIFGFNPILWHSFGIILRICASLALSLMVWGLTRSKKIAVLSGLFFAPSVAGSIVVSFSSAHAVLVQFILICIGFYFWFQNMHKKNKKDFILSVVFLGLASVSSPPRFLLMALIILLWEIFSYVVAKHKERLRWIALRLGVLYATFFAIMFSYRALLPGVYAYSASQLQAYLLNPALFIAKEFPHLPAFFSSIGNLLFGWLIFPSPLVSELISGEINIATPTILILSLSLCIGFYLGLARKSKNALAFTFFILVIVLMFIPNWLAWFQKGVISAEHRYLGLSSIGYIGAMAILVGSLKNRKLMVFIATLFIIANIFIANRNLKTDSSFRSIKVVDSIWNTILKDVPKEEKNSIFIFHLDPLEETKFALNYAGGVTYAVKQGISSLEDLPLLHPDPDNIYPDNTDRIFVVLKLLCEDKKSHPFSGDLLIPLKSNISLSHVHAWEMKNATLTNISEVVREQIRKEALLSGCRLK